MLIGQVGQVAFSENELPALRNGGPMNDVGVVGGVLVGVGNGVLVEVGVAIGVSVKVGVGGISVGLRGFFVGQGIGC